MDQDKELARAKWLLGFLGLFLITGFFAFSELRYTIWGKTVSANVTQTKQFSEPGRRGKSNEVLSVEYSFPNESGSVSSERDLLPADWPIAGNTVSVQYIPGEADSSRIAGHRSMGSVYLFLGSLVVITGFAFVFYREAKASERRPARRSR